ncbi:MAG: PAS domain S-box protein [Caulobacter sp.]|nr:PAS domain S-box protein [Caulobacter sp.]
MSDQDTPGRPAGDLPARILALESALAAERESARQALAESQSRFTLIADSIPTLCWMADETGWIHWYNRRWYEYTGKTPAEMEGWGWQSVHHPDVLPEVMTRWPESIRTGEPFEMVFPLRGADGVFRPFLTRITPSRDETGKITGWLGVNTDVTELSQAQERQKLLLNELNHRVKNTLATVQSIAFQTLRAARSPVEFRQAFEARLMALSQTHNLLTDSNWEGASLREVLAAELEPYSEHQVDIDDREDVTLGPKAAVALGMAFHELATNAAKYGPLSGAKGRVVIRWRPVGDGERLELVWREEGGPPVVAPDRTGFGSRLLEQGLGAELGGEVAIAYAPTGVVATLTLPFAALA